MKPGLSTLKMKSGSGRKMKNQKAGFSLIETLVSLTILLLAVLLGAGMLTAAMQSYRNAHSSIYLLQELESFKNHLLSIPYHSVEWQAGEKIKEEDNLRFNWSIQEISQTLKLADLTITNKSGQKRKRTYFYRSKYFNNFMGNN